MITMLSYFHCCSEMACETFFELDDDNLSIATLLLDAIFSVMWTVDCEESLQFAYCLIEDNF